MDLPQVSSFNEALSGIDKTKSYVAVSGGKCYKVEGKSLKANTHQIASLADEAFTSVQKNNASYSDKAKYYTDLASGLSDYLSRLNSSKNVFQRIGSFFGFQSADEKAIKQTCKDSAERASQLIEQDQHAKSDVKRVIDRATKHSQADPLVQLKLFYMSVLDSSELTIPALDGLGPLDAANWLLEHLKAFRSAHPKQAVLLDSVIREVEEYIYVVGMDDILHANPSASRKDWTEQELLSKLHSLKSKGQELALEGGYRRYVEGKGGHAVQYLLKKEQDSTYTLTFVNTGEGIELSSPILDGARSLWNALWGKPERLHTRDDVWQGIPEEALNIDFVRELLHFAVGNEPTKMSDVKQAFSKLLSKYPTVRETKGKEEHKIQNKGSCTVKSLTSWMHVRLGNTLFREFKVFYTDRELAKVDKLLPKVDDLETREAIKTEARKVQRKRYAKKEKAIHKPPKTEEKGPVKKLKEGQKSPEGKSKSFMTRLIEKIGG